MADVYDSAAVQIIDQEIENILRKPTTKKARFATFEDLYENLADPKREPISAPSIRIKQEKILHTYIEDGAVPLTVESEEEEVNIPDPIVNPAHRIFNKKIKNEYDEEQELVESVFDQLYHAHIKTEEETLSRPVIEENIANVQYDNSFIRTSLYGDNEEDVVENNNITSPNAGSSKDFISELDSHQAIAQAARVVLRSTPNNSNNNSMLIEEKSVRQPDPIIDEQEIDLNAADSDEKPANESQEVYITGMNIKKQVVTDIFNDDDDFQLPIQQPTNTKQKENKKPAIKSEPMLQKKGKKSKNNTNKMEDIQVQQKPAKIAELGEIKEIKNSTNEGSRKKKNASSVTSANHSEISVQNGTEQIALSRSKRRVVLQNMNKKYTDELKVVDGYFANKLVNSNNMLQSPKTKVKTTNKIIQRWTLYCWGRRGSLRHHEFSPPILKHKDLITYYKTLLDKNRQRVDADKIRTSSSSYIHAIALDINVIAYVVNLGDKLTLNKQSAFVNKRGIQYKGRTFKSIEEWSSACLKENSFRKEDLTSLLSKIEVNNKGSLKQAMAKVKPAIQIMKSQPFLKRNVSRFVEVARKKSRNKSLFSNINNITWPPEEELERYIYPTDFNTSTENETKPKKRKIAVVESSIERPKKKLKAAMDENVLDPHNNPYLLRRNKDSEPVVSEANNGKADHPIRKTNRKKRAESTKEKPIESMSTAEKIRLVKETAKDGTKERSIKVESEKVREQPILEHVEKSNKNRTDKPAEKTKPVIPTHKNDETRSNSNGNITKHNTKSSKEKEHSSKASLRGLTDWQHKKKKSTWLQNIKPVNNNNDLKSLTESSFASDPKITLPKISEKQEVIEVDDLIYDEFFS